MRIFTKLGHRLTFHAFPGLFARQREGELMANLERCPTCANETSARATVCPKCGEPFAEGWAEEIARTRQNKRDQLALDVKLHKKAARRRWLWVAGILVVVFFGPGIGNSLYLEYLEAFDPSRLEEITREREQERLAEVEVLMAEAAKIPASDFVGNILAYKKLVELSPGDERFTKKVSYYETKRDAAVVELKRLKAEEEGREAANKKRKGFHCLSAWDGSHRGVENYIKDRLKDPGSFEHIETRITPVSPEGTHSLTMKYRAKNGFGGYTVGAAVAVVSNEGCRATILSAE